MEPEQMLKYGAIGGFLTAIFLIIGPIALWMGETQVEAAILTGNVTAALQGLITMFYIAGIVIILAGIVMFLFSIGFYGGAKKFEKGVGTGAFVLGILAAIGYIIMGVSIMGLPAAIQSAINTGSTEALLGAIGGMAIGLIIAGIFGFIFGILAMVYFFGTEKGTIGGVGGLLAFIGGIVGIISVAIGYGLVFIGYILMGVAFWQQASL